MDEAVVDLHTKRSAAEFVGNGCEASLLNAALAEPELLDQFEELPKSSDFLAGWNPLLWECVLETRAAGAFSITAFTQRLREHGFTAHDVNKVLENANPAFLYRSELASSVRFILDRRLVIRSQSCVQEYLSTIEKEPYWKAAGTLERLQRQLADVAVGAVAGETWAIGDKISKQNAVCVPSGISSLDDMTGGVELSTLGILGARPSQGKSALECAIALNMASREQGVGIFSLEMPKYSLLCRMASAWAYQPGEMWGGNSGNPYYEPFLKEKMPDGSHLKRMNSAIADVRRMPLAIDDQKGLTVSAIRARTRRLKAIMEHKGAPLRAVFIDHIGHITPENNRGGNRTAELTDISKGLMDMAGELGIAVVALSQLNRAVEQRTDKRPNLADLRDSGSLEQDAAWVAFLYRDEYYADRERDDPDAKPRRVERNTLEVGIAKQRNGPVGTVKLFCEMGANAILDQRQAVNARVA